MLLGGWMEQITTTVGSRTDKTRRKVRAFRLCPGDHYEGACEESISGEASNVIRMEVSTPVEAQTSADHVTKLPGTTPDPAWPDSLDVPVPEVQHHAPMVQQLVADLGGHGGSADADPTMVDYGSREAVVHRVVHGWG